jgi:trehalose-6-phosphate synthase
MAAPATAAAPLARNATVPEFLDALQVVDATKLLAGTGIEATKKISRDHELSPVYLEPVVQFDRHIQVVRAQTVGLLKAGGVATALAASNPDAVVCCEPDKESVGKTSQQIKVGDRDVSLVKIQTTPEQEQGYYLDVANGRLWPKFHGMDHKISPECSAAAWKEYVMFNWRFAEAAMESMTGPSNLLDVHDYQVALVPGMIRAMKPDAHIAFKSHIPYPDGGILDIPEGAHLVRGMLGASSVCFHTREFANNFLDDCEKLGYHVDREASAVWVREQDGSSRIVLVTDIPIALDPEVCKRMIADKKLEDMRGMWNDEKVRPDGYTPEQWDRVFDKILDPNTILTVSAERSDYTKAVPQRLMAVGQVRDENPDIADRLLHIQCTAPTREKLQAYKDEMTYIRNAAKIVNSRPAADGVPPVILADKGVPNAIVLFLYLRAQVVMATPIKDGMNLAPWEAAGIGSTAALVLGRGAGAATIFKEDCAIHVDGGNIRDVARGLTEAIRMSEAERLARAARYQEIQKAYNVHTWGSGRVRACQLAHTINQLLKAGEELVLPPHSYSDGGIDALLGG